MLEDFGVESIGRQEGKSPEGQRMRTAEGRGLSTSRYHLSESAQQDDRHTNLMERVLNYTMSSSRKLQHMVDVEGKLRFLREHLETDSFEKLPAVSLVEYVVMHHPMLKIS